MQHLEDTSTPMAVAIAIGAYSLCSASLLLLNKMALEFLRVPAAVSLLQIVFAAVVVFLMKVTGLQKVDSLELEKMKSYGVYIFAFVAAIYCNMKALQASNVETVIVFRSCTPIAVCLIEYLFMDRQWPEMRSQISLGCVALGAIAYCMTDSEFAMNGIGAYYWVTMYFVLITFEMTYGKMLTSNVKMETVWGPVFYCNVLAMAPMYILGSSTGDFEGLGEKFAEVPVMGAWLILASCVVGTLIGYSGWMCRGMVSATTYTLVGVVNKFLTILLNVFLWDKHASWFGILCVCSCLCAGVFYQQAPKRNSDSLPFAASTTRAASPTQPRPSSGSSPRKAAGVELGSVRADELEPLTKQVDA
jgi:GDP-mannose transporter